MREIPDRLLSRSHGCQRADAFAFGPIDCRTGFCSNPLDMPISREPLKGLRIQATSDAISAMQRRARQLLLASLLALYGVMTVCGPALHALPGAGHVKAGSLGGGDGPDHPTRSHNDCPVCHFLAQVQIAGDSAHAPSMDVVRIQPVDDLPITFPPSIDRPSAPRAPPFA